MALAPTRTVAELHELRELTGDENGAQRVAWTTRGRGAGVARGEAGRPAGRGEMDEAGNGGAPSRGDSERALLLGGHIDSVRTGAGWTAA